MSLRAIVEIIIHLENFRNLDLMQGGLYWLQFEVFHTIKGKKFFATPYSIYTIKGTSSVSCNIPGQTEDIYFKSQIFNIKYCDDDIDIKEIAIFRAEIEISNEDVLPCLSINCHLMCPKLVSNLNEEITDYSYYKTSNFTPESSLEIKILDFLGGKNQFLPIVFDDSHFCLMNSTIHAILIDFRFRASPMRSTPEENAQILHKNSQNKEIDKSITLSDIFFPGAIEVTDDLIDKVNKKYIKHLITVYEKVYKLINDWLQYLNESDFIEAKNKIDQISSSFDLKVNVITSSYGSFVINGFHDRNSSIVSELIIQDIQMLAGKMHNLLQLFIEILTKASRDIALALMYDYNTQLKDR